jgi:L-lactate dehydrogenase complex protein LldG
MKPLIRRKTKRDCIDILSERSEILKKINEALSGKVKVQVPLQEVPFFNLIEGSLSDTFKKMLEDIGGKVIIVKDWDELAEGISTLISENGWNEIVCAENRINTILTASGIAPECKNSLSENTDVVITGCEYLVAGLGSVLVSTAHTHSRRMFVYPPVHVVVAQSSQLVETAEEAWEKTILRYNDHLPSMISMITGPSRTADIEKTLILGAHGPKMLYVFIVNHEYCLK